MTTIWHDVGEADAFTEEAGQPVTVTGIPIAIFRVKDELFALHDLCTHGAAKLSDGYVEDGCIECPLHQGTFDLRTGAPCSAPAVTAVQSYPIRLQSGRVEIAINND
jgi:anthranilate 1,2-dioxygenase ferredoxin subunit